MRLRKLVNVTMGGLETVARRERVATHHVVPRDPALTVSAFALLGTAAHRVSTLCVRTNQESHVVVTEHA